MAKEEHGQVYGRPSVSEIELGQCLKQNWETVAKWLHSMNLLRVAGIDFKLPPNNA
jgi:hypothetical protein